MLGRFTKHITEGLETDTVELKAFDPPTNNDPQIEKIVKEILAMANTGKQGFMLFGVNDANNRQRGREPVPGCTETRSDDEVQRHINDKLSSFSNPSVLVRYSSYDWQGKRVGVLGVPRSKRRPHMVAKNGTDCLRRGHYPIRRGTVIDVLTPDELKEIPHVAPKKAVTLLNFTHFYTEPQLEQLEELLGCCIESVWPDCKIDFNPESDFETQARELADSLGYEPEEWQEAGRFVVSLPGFSEAAAALLAELHGRMGQFPTIVRRRQVAGPSGTYYVVAEVIDLTQIRGRARQHGARMFGQ